MYYVLAGTNGAGKSSIAGAMLLQQGTEYFNPDEASKRISAANPGITQTAANSAAWNEGRQLLEQAIARRLSFAFETTLGGRTIRNLLETALSVGMEVRIWYVGLSSPELHIARVQARVSKGGHNIPEDRIRQRYNSSRLNLIELLPALTELRLYDNSEEADPITGIPPQPKLILHLRHRKIVASCKLPLVPEWGKPIMAAALRLT